VICDVGHSLLAACRQPVFAFQKGGDFSLLDGLIGRKSAHSPGGELFTFTVGIV